MRMPNHWLAATGLIVAVAALAVYGPAFADDTAKKDMAPMKAISQPFLDGLLGSWTTESTGTHDGQTFKGTGKTTYARAIGGTAIVQNYESTTPGPDGKTMNFNGHGVSRLSDDGKTLTLWWFCNMYPDPLKLSGPITSNSIDLTGDAPHGGGTVNASFTKTADGVTFKLTEGENEMKETYKRASLGGEPPAPASR